MQRKGIMRRGQIITVIFFVIVLLWALSSQASADSVLLGSDYLHTIPPTHFDFGGPIGVIDLQGRSLGPGNPPPPGYPTSGLGNTDTIVQRQADAILPTVGSSATVPIEMVALSLQSVTPVNVGGSFFDVFVHLTPGMRSVGQMTIHHEFADNPSFLSPGEGTFTSFFDVFFTADFTPTGAGSPLSINGDLPLNGTGNWNHEPPSGVVLVSGLPGDQIANLHSPSTLGFKDFFPIGIQFDGGTGIGEIHPGAGIHTVELATVPEPSTFLLFGSGLASIAAFGRKRLGKKGEAHPTIQFSDSRLRN